MKQLWPARRQFSCSFKQQRDETRTAGIVAELLHVQSDAKPGAEGQATSTTLEGRCAVPELVQMAHWA